MSSPHASPLPRRRSPQDGFRAAVPSARSHREDRTESRAQASQAAEGDSVLALLAAGTMTPVVDSTWNVAEAASAWERLESGGHFGKIVLDWTV